MSVRYKYQLVRALDDKIGPDLRGLVEGYLGPDPEPQRTLWQEVVSLIGGPWCMCPKCQEMITQHCIGFENHNEDWSGLELDLLGLSALLRRPRSAQGARRRRIREAAHGVLMPCNKRNHD